MKTNEEHGTGSCGVVRTLETRMAVAVTLVRSKIFVHVVPVYKLIMSVYPSRFSLVPITLAESRHESKNQAVGGREADGGHCIVS